MKKILAALAVTLAMTGCASLSVCSEANLAHLNSGNEQLARMDAEIEACKGRERCVGDLSGKLMYGSKYNFYYATLIEEYNFVLNRQRQDVAYYNKTCAAQ